MPDSGDGIELGVYRVNGRLLFVERDLEEYAIGTSDDGVKRLYDDPKYSGVRVTRIGTLRVGREELRRPSSSVFKVRFAGFSREEEPQA